MLSIAPQRLVIFALAAVLIDCDTRAADGLALLQDAEARIARHRQADACIRVVDAAGKEVSAAEVKVEQASHAFLFGCNIFLWGRVGSEQDEQTYRRRFAELFNYATLPFYWPSYERRRGQPDHERTERVARWCGERGILAKGHPLAWNFSDPSWLPDDVAEIRRLQMARIDDCVARFRGLIDRWDVVNEATHFERESFQKRSPKMTKMWEAAGRVEFVRECFTHARSANPAATLVLNDYRADSAFESLLNQSRDDKSKPIFDVIGIQSHMHGGTWTNERIWEVCERFAKFGVPLHFTETTILSGERGWRENERATDWPSTEERERWQAGEVERFYTMLFSHPAVAAVTWWDFSDRNAWQGAPAGFLRKDMSPKPAYDRLLGLVKGRWWTKASGRSMADGSYRFRGFLGGYRVTVTGPGGQTGSGELTLRPAQPNELTIRLAP